MRPLQKILILFACCTVNQTLVNFLLSLNHHISNNIVGDQLYLAMSLNCFEYERMYTAVTLKQGSCNFVVVFSAVLVAFKPALQ